MFNYLKNKWSSNFTNTTENVEQNANEKKTDEQKVDKKKSDEHKDENDWKESAKGNLKSYYLGFGGSQWHDYGKEYDVHDMLLLAKICFAMFGYPTNELAVELHDGYTDQQKESASLIMKKILEIYKKVPSEELLVSIIFIFCKTDENEFPLPLFCVFASGDPLDPRAERQYIDTQKRTYKDWNDWKNNNTLPMLKYAYPRHGFFTSSPECQYVFDPNGDPDIEFGQSPQSELSARILKKTDTLSAITSLGCGGIAVISLFTPIAPAVLLVSAVSGAGSAVYGTTRAIARLVDKGKHNENLADFESMMLYFSIAATPLNFTTSIVNASLVRGATVNGRIFSDSYRMFATIINFSTLGVDAVLVGFGLANMIDKYKNGEINKLDVLQFSMSLFFFTNTLIKPQIAANIIKNAQEQHIQQYANSMTDEAARATFKKFVNDNAGTGSIKDTSKIVRTINKIENPDMMFGGLKNADNILIGGRKGKTLLVTDQNQRTNRIKTDKVLLTTETVRNISKSFSLKKCFNGKDITEIRENNRSTYLNNLSNKEKARVNKVILDVTKNNKNMVEMAMDISDTLGCQNVQEFLSVVEIVAADVNKQKIATTDAINNIRSNYNKLKIENIKNDLKIAEQLTSQRDINFIDPYKAVYHYRKHGSEFASKIKSIRVYLNKVPNQLITDGNIAEIITNQDSTITKIYNTSNDGFAVVVENVDNRIIKTMHKSNGSYESFRAKLREVNDVNTLSNFLDPIHEYITDRMGFRGFSIQLIIANDEVIDVNPNWRSYVIINGRKMLISYPK